MAGYDFEFTYPASLKRSATTWLVFFKRTAQILDLDSSYRTNRVQLEKLKVYVSVDGQLPNMQYLSRALPREAIVYLRTSQKANVVAEKIIRPFINSNKASVIDLSGFVFYVAGRFSPKEAPASAASLAISSKIIEIASNVESVTREENAIRSIINALDEWFSGGMTKENALVLCDQGIENWLKSHLGIPAESRENFPTILKKAKIEDIISQSQAERLEIGHKARNRVQHRGAAILANTFIDMADCSIEVLNKNVV